MPSHMRSSQGNVSVGCLGLAALLVIGVVALVLLLPRSPSRHIPPELSPVPSAKIIAEPEPEEANKHETLAERAERERWRTIELRKGRRANNRSARETREAMLDAAIQSQWEGLMRSQAGGGAPGPVGGGVPGPAGGPVHVRGYFRQDGTYVNPYTRSAPGR